MCTDETLSVRSVTSFIHAKKNKELLREDSFKPWLMIMMIPKFPNFGDGFQTNKWPQVPEGVANQPTAMIAAWLSCFEGKV